MMKHTKRKDEEDISVVTTSHESQGSRAEEMSSDIYDEDDDDGDEDEEERTSHTMISMTMLKCKEEQGGGSVGGGLHLKRKYRKIKNNPVVHVNNVSSNPYKVRLPKILSSDIRKQYPVMLMNTLNSMDMSLMYEFCHQFTHRDSVLQRRLMSPAAHLSDREVERLTFHGCEEIFQYVYLLSLLSPDRVVQMKKEAAIVTRSDSFRSEIILEGEASSTWIVDSDPMRTGRFLQDLHHKRMQQLKRDRPSLDLSTLENLFANQHRRRSDGPLAVRTSGRIILVIYNVYENPAIDEIIFETRGLYDTARRLHITTELK